MAASPETTSSFEPSSDLIQGEECDTLLLYVPGFKKEQLRVQLDHTGLLKFRATRPDGEDKWISFQKEFHVSPNCDTSKISAKFEDGILYVRQPKLIVPAKKEEINLPPQEAPQPQRTTEGDKSRKSNQEAKQNISKEISQKSVQEEPKSTEEQKRTSSYGRSSIPPRFRNISNEISQKSVQEEPQSTEEGKRTSSYGRSSIPPRFRNISNEIPQKSVQEEPKSTKEEKTSRNYDVKGGDSKTSSNEHKNVPKKNVNSEFVNKGVITNDKTKVNGYNKLTEGSPVAELNKAKKMMNVVLVVLVVFGIGMYASNLIWRSTSSKPKI